MMYYFAYGSNMDFEQMSDRCPNAILLGCATLREYRLGFTIFSKKRQCGCADIIASSTGIVYGLLYEMTDEDMATLDTFEGHPVHYKRIMVSVEMGDEVIDACSYEVVHKQDGLNPSQHYLGLIQKAALRHQFTEAYQSMLRGIQTLD